MLELVLAALLQFNSIFVGVDAAETGGNGWGDGQVTSTAAAPAETGGNGWGDGQVTSPTSSFDTGGNGWGDGQ